MLEKIEALRKRPKAVRDSYAFGIALSVTTVVALIWLISLPARFNSTDTVATDNDEKDEPSFQENISDLRNVLSEGLENIQNQAKLISATNEEFSSSTPTTTPDIVTGSSTDTVATTSEEIYPELAPVNPTSTEAI